MGRRRGGSGFAIPLTVIAASALALRVAYILLFRDQHTPFFGDSLFYSRSAWVLAQGKWFVEPLTAFSRHPVPAADHPPLYVVWLAIPSIFADGHVVSQTGQMLWSAVLGTGTVVLFGLAGREIAGPRVGLIAAALAAVYPNIWINDGELLSETMAIFTVVLVILLAYRLWNRPSVARVAWLGAACGLASLARPELLLAAPLVLVPLVLLTRDVSWTRRFGWIAVGAIATVAVVGPWVAYNLSRFREPVYISMNAGGTLSAANCDATYSGPLLGYKDYGCGYEIGRRVLRPGMDPSEGEKAIREEAMKYIRAHTDRLPVVVLARWGRILELYHPSTDIRFNEFVMQREPPVAWAGLLSWYLLVLVAIPGVFILRRRRVPIFPLLVFPVVVLMSVAVTFAQLRYRAPAEPSVVFLAAMTIGAGISRYLARRGTEKLADPMVPDEPQVAAV